MQIPRYSAKKNNTILTVAVCVGWELLTILGKDAGFAQGNVAIHQTGFVDPREAQCLELVLRHSAQNCSKIGQCVRDEHLLEHVKVVLVLKFRFRFLCLREFHGVHSTSLRQQLFRLNHSSKLFEFDYFEHTVRVDVSVETSQHRGVRARIDVGEIAKVVRWKLFVKLLNFVLTANLKNLMSKN